jgi:hypothetical protein
MARLASALVFASVLACAAAAQAEARPYRGPHPVDHRGNWHLQDSVHVHDELAVGTEPFASVDGVLVFLGDPVEYGYDGSVWRYRGVHPLPARIGGYCGLESEHRHPFAPEGQYRREDGVFVFNGALRGGVQKHRPGRVHPPEEVRRAAETADRAPAYGVWWAGPRPRRGHAHPHRHGHHARRKHPGDRRHEAHGRHGRGHNRRHGHHARDRGFRIQRPQCTGLTSSRISIVDRCPPKGARRDRRPGRAAPEPRERESATPRRFPSPRRSPDRESPRTDPF